MPRVYAFNPGVRQFLIVRHATNRARRINCQFCGRRINPMFYYNIHENYDVLNDNPLHTLSCAEQLIADAYVFNDTPYMINYENADDSEETTE